jgi:signal transduction histidine kinase
VFAEGATALVGGETVITQLVDEIEEIAQLPRLAVGQFVFGMPRLLELTPALTIDALLALLVGFTRSTGVALWTYRPGDALETAGHVGDFDPQSPEARRLASRILAAAPGSVWQEREALGLTLGSPNQPAALVAKTPLGSTDEQLALLEVSVPILITTLERDNTLSDATDEEQAVVAATERRLTRLRFDLHDGPQQNLVMLGEDLRLFSSQLASVIASGPVRERLLGRLDDLQAQLVALDGDLRRIAHSLESPFLVPEPLPRALAKLVEAFAARTGTEPELRLDGDLSGLTDSQQITLLGLITEALANIREHARADRVSILVSVDGEGVKATVTDNGQGFDPEATLIRAAREGHLGLVGMHERVRLLGGQTQIDSCPGGPTVISVTVPAGPASATQSQSA